MTQLSYSVRSMIVAPKDHYLVNFDLAQAESWIVAYLADEPKMKESLNHGDFHKDTAFLALFPSLNSTLMDKDEYKATRYIGKQYNHATCYRMGPYKAAEVINAKSDKPPFVTVTYAESKKNTTNWHNYYFIKDWWREIEEQLNKNRTITTPYGRSRVFFDQWGEQMFKKATAYIPQSTIADHMNGMVQEELGIPGGVLTVYEELDEPGMISIWNQSHDSILYVVHKDLLIESCHEVHKRLLRPLIVNGEEIKVPVDCEIGERWGELEEQERKVGEYEIRFAA